MQFSVISLNNIASSAFSNLLKMKFICHYIAPVITLHQIQCTTVINSILNVAFDQLNVNLRSAYKYDLIIVRIVVVILANSFVSNSIHSFDDSDCNLKLNQFIIWQLIHSLLLYFFLIKRDGEHYILEENVKSKIPIYHSIFRNKNV